MFYIVPETDRRANGFVVRFTTEETLYQLPLDTNTLKTLQRLAMWLNIQTCTALPKELLISEILHHLTLTPLEIAVARFPILGLPHPTTAEGCMLIMMEISRVQAKWPLDAGLFPVHFGLVLEKLAAQRRTLIAEEQRAARAAEESRWAAPDWWEGSLTEAPTGEHIKITVRVGDQFHDGWCSEVDEDDLYVVDWEEKIVYLPLEEDVVEQLQEKDEWGTWATAGDHCCCGARQIIQLRGWEKVTA